MNSLAALPISLISSFLKFGQDLPKHMTAAKSSCIASPFVVGRIGHAMQFNHNLAPYIRTEYSVLRSSTFEARLPRLKKSFWP